MSFYLFAEEQITYRKVGDHATNMPSVMRFGEKRNGQYVILDNIKYKYDNCGNISEVWENGKLAAKYTYDKLNRLVREDNKQLGKTWLYSYDNNGNILSKRELAFTLCGKEKIEELESTDIVYSYDGDRLLSFGNELFVYDGLGNPTTYRGKACVWEKERQLASYNGNTFTYDGQGRRTSKNATQYTYDGNGNLIKQSDETNTLEFIYDNGGIAGLKHNGVKYIYRRDAQGNISAILDSNGAVVVKYIYNAWGNHAVVDANGKDLEYKENDEKNNKYYALSQLNPFRYRGYYYDAETELYFLKTRYYDPEVGRFTTIDDLQYLDPETINGLNLYAYCGNNPVMNVDPTGEFFLTFLLIGIFAGAVIGGAINGVKAYNAGQRGWGLFGAIAGGAIMGGAMGAVFVLGGAAGLSAAIAPLGLSIAGFTLGTGAALGISIGIGVGAGLISYSLENGLRTDRDWTISGFLTAGLSGGLKATATFGIGYLGGKMGAFDKMLLNPMLEGVSTISTSVTYNISKIILSQMLPSIGRTLFTKLSMFTGEMIAKMLIFSTLGAGVRWLIDKIFGG